MNYRWQLIELEKLITLAKRTHNKIWYCGIMKDVFVRGVVGIIGKSELGFSSRDIRRRLKTDYESFQYSIKRVTYMSASDEEIRFHVEAIRRVFL